MEALESVQVRSMHGILRVGDESHRMTLRPVDTMFYRCEFGKSSSFKQVDCEGTRSTS